MEQDFILLLSNPNVRRFGDSLEFIERYIAESYETRAGAALAELYYRVPKDSLNGSAKRALEMFNYLKSYPEAEFWMGETYKVEGELSLAIRQYERAFESRALLEIPEFEVEILYRLVDIHRIRGNLKEMEKRALEIIEGQGPSNDPRDRLWGTSSSTQFRVAMARILENEGVDRFFTLYRYNNTETEKAHRLLGFFYYASNRYTLAADHLMFAFLIQNTVLIEEVLRQQFDYNFTNLEDLMDMVRTNRELMDFIDETQYYRTIFYLSSALYATGKSRPSSQLWAFLAQSADAGEWGERARRNPTPYTDRTLVY
jgi:tetratricopeptide (TPR) repeat protein